MIMTRAQVAEIRENPWADISFLLCSSAITSDAIGILAHLYSLTGALETTEAEV